MNNFIFKSSKGLIKNDSIDTDVTVIYKLEIIQKELRHQRQDNKDMMLMLNKLLIDKHLQMQVDTYFDEDVKNDIHPEDKQDLD